MYNDQVTSFNLPLDDALGPMLPFTMPSNRSDDMAYTLGENYMGPRVSFEFDPVNAKRKRDAFSSTIVFWGDVDSGKSAFGKIFAAEYSAVYNHRRKLRIYADDHRQLHGKNEFQRLAECMNSQLVTIKRRINVFDPDLPLTTADHMETSVAIYEDSNDGRAPVRYQKLCMRVALHKMLVTDTRTSDDDGNPLKPVKPSAERYAAVLLEIGQEETTEFIKGVVQSAKEADEADDAILMNTEERNELTDADAKAEAEELAANSSNLEEKEYNVENIDWAAFREDAGLVATAVLNFLEGEFGNTFGGEGSFADLFSQRFVGIDYSTRGDIVKAFLIAFVMRIKMTAVRRVDMRFWFDIELIDESNKLMAISPTFLRTFARDLKEARNTSRIKFVMLHRPQDLDTLGEYSELARNAIRDVGIACIGRVSDEDALDALARMYGFGDTEKAIIRELPVGCYAICYGRGPVVFMRIPLNSFRAYLIETNEANYDALVRRDPMSIEEETAWHLQNLASADA